MKRKVWNPLQAIRDNVARLMMGWLRVSAYMAFLCLIFAGFSVHAAWGAIGEKSLAVGEQMAELEDLLGRTKTLYVNGQRMHVSTVVVDLGVEAALDRFQKVCGDNPSGLARLIDEKVASLGSQALAPAPESQAGTPPDMFRKSDSDQGMLLCFADRKHSDLSTKALLEEFAKTLDVSLFGDAMYVFAKKTESTNRTHVITTWTEGSFKPFDMFVADRDAPGDDSTMIARPINSRRLLSATPVDAPYGVRLYESDETEERLFETFDIEMAARGWEKGEAKSIKKNGRLFFHSTTGILAEAFSTRKNGKTIFSTVEMGKVTDGALPRP
jgi:hypothetical protein